MSKDKTIKNLERKSEAHEISRLQGKLGGAVSTLTRMKESLEDLQKAQNGVALKIKGYKEAINTYREKRKNLQERLLQRKLAFKRKFK